MAPQRCGLGVSPHSGWAALVALGGDPRRPEVLLRAVEERGFAIAGLAILQSNGRQGASLEAILASHALIHTADGEHFRGALAEAARCCGTEAARIRQKELHERAAAALKRPIEELRGYVASLGKSVGPPWGADQKSAALLAWLTLAR
jgi:hypothetical protein